MKVVAVSVTGTSHEERGQPCQDAHAYSILPEGVLIAAVADGAGSAALGEVGAQIAAGAAVEKIERLMAQGVPQNDDGWKLLLTEALSAAKIAVETESTVRQVLVRDLASTLIVVVATSELVAVAQVGDGTAVVGQEGNVLALTTPQSGEYINETTFLISPNAVEKAQLVVWHGNPAQLAILSDGLQMLALKMPEGTPHPPFFLPLFRFIVETKEESQAREKLRAFLQSPRLLERTDDDLTLLLATFVNYCSYCRLG